MKAPQPNDPDPALRQVLQEWRAEASLPPDFQNEVWRRINRAPAPARLSIWSALPNWVESALPRPMLAAAYMVIFVSIGVAGGWSQARQANARAKEELGERYVRVLDPYLAPRQ
jgi:hypothetical protein